MVQVRAISEGFDLYPSPYQEGYGLTSVWFSAGGAFSLQPGRFEGQCLSMDSSGDLFRVFAEDEYGCAGFAYKMGVVENRTIARFQSADGQDQFAICRSGSNQLYLVRGHGHDSGVTLTSTALPVLVPGTWHYIEISWRIHDTLGELHVRVDGLAVAALDYSGDTRLTGDGSNVGRVNLTSLGSGLQRYDDFYLETGGMVFVGEGRFEVLSVTGDVSTTGFTPSVGTLLYPVLSNVPVTTAYNASALTTGDIFRLLHEPLPTTPETIYGLQLLSVSQKDEAGTRTVRNRLWSGAFAYQGATRALTLDTYTFKEDWLAQDPNTSLAWTRTALNAAQVGVEVTL